MIEILLSFSHRIIHCSLSLERKEPKIGFAPCQAVCLTALTLRHCDKALCKTKSQRRRSRLIVAAKHHLEGINLERRPPPSDLSRIWLDTKQTPPKKRPLAFHPGVLTAEDIYMCIYIFFASIHLPRLLFRSSLRGRSGTLRNISTLCTPRHFLCGSFHQRNVLGAEGGGARAGSLSLSAGDRLQF